MIEISISSTVNPFLFTEESLRYSFTCVKPSDVLTVVFIFLYACKFLIHLFSFAVKKK